MTSASRPDPPPIEETWGLIALFIVDLFLGDVVAGLLAIAVLLRRTRRNL